MTNAIKIIPEIWTGSSTWADSIYFDEDEYHYCKVSFPKQCYIQESQKQAPNIYDAGKANSNVGTDRYVLTIQFYHAFSTTEAKILSLFGYHNRFRIYHRYIEYPTLNRYYILDPNYDIIYKYGEKAAEIYSVLKFYETFGTY